MPPLHISRIGPFLQILAIRENTGRPGRGSGMTREEGGRNGEKWVETGRSGENNPPLPPPPPSYWPVLEKHGKIGKKREQYGRHGNNMGAIREQHGSKRHNTGNTGDFSPSRTSTWSRFSGCPADTLLDHRWTR